MIGQFIFFALFIMTFFTGAFVYFSPKQQPFGPLPAVIDNSEIEMTEESSTTESQQLNMTTMKGVVQIRRQMDELTREQKKLIEFIDDEQKILNSTNKKITDILKQVNGRNDMDILKLKALGLDMKNEQRLLVERGQALVSFNDQLIKSRLWLVRQNDLLNFYNVESLRMLQQHNALLNDQSSASFEKVIQQNNDIIEHTQDLIDEEREKSQDQQIR